MAEQGRTTLKGYFETGDKPTQSQFEDLIDSVPNTSDSGVSNTEFGYLGGVTSAIQTQLDAKIASVVEDTTPQLGGNLDVNGNDITGNPAIDGRRAIVTEADTAKTLALTDAGDFIVTTNASATTVSIPRNDTVAFPTGTEIDFIQKGAGQLTIQAAGASVTLNGVSAGSTTITAQWGGATIKKIDTDEWVIVGKINDVA